MIDKEDEEKDKKTRWKSVISRLKSATILSNKLPFLHSMSLNTMRKVRDAVFPGVLNEATGTTDNPYHAAKERFNQLWNWRENRKKVGVPPSHPLHKLTSVRGAMAAYWTGEQLKESLKPTLGIVALVTFSSVNTTMMLEAYAETLSALFNDGDAVIGATKFGMMAGAGYLSNKYIMKLANDVKRGMAFYVRDQFKHASAITPEIIPHLAEKISQDKKSEQDVANNSSPHHAIARAPEELSQTVVDTAIQGFSCVTTATALLMAIAQNAQHVPLLGDRGTLIVALATVLPYAGYSYFRGAKLGQAEELTLEAQQKAESILTENLVKGFDSEKTPDSERKFEDLFHKDNARILEAAKKNDMASEKYRNFMYLTNIGGFFVSPMPALASIPWTQAGVLSAVTQQSFLATHAQTQFLLNTVTQGINLIASRGRMTVPAKVVANMASDFIEAEKLLAKQTDRSDGKAPESVPVIQTQGTSPSARPN